MSNESILSLSDDVKASMRCYAVMAGFLLLGVLKLCPAVMGGLLASDINLVESAILVTLGTVLAFLHKRDLYAIFFILMGFMYAIFSLEFTPVIDLSAGILCLFLAVAFCLTRNEQRIVVSVLLAFIGVDLIALYLGSVDAFNVISAVSAVLCIYFAFAIGCERFKLPLRDILMADEENPSNDGTPVHFKVSGTSICIAVKMFTTLLFILMAFGLGTMDWELAPRMYLSVSVIEILAGLIMLTAGRMRQTPFIFIMFGAIGLIAAGGAGGTVITCAFEIILGLLILLRSESRILLGLLVLFIGLVSIPRLIDPGLMMVSLAIQIITLVLEAYLILALNSDGRLKLI